MDLISCQTWKKHHFGKPWTNNYVFCGEDCGYFMFKSKYPKDVARLIIHKVFTDEEISKMQFVYVPQYYRGNNNLMDRIDVYYKKVK